MSVGAPAPSSSAPDQEVIGQDRIDLASVQPPRPSPVVLRDKDAGRMSRRLAPIHAYVGGGGSPNGGGKTLAMVHDTLPSLHQGRKVLSTVELLDARTGEPWPNYERLTTWEQLLEARHADVLFDEVVGIASSRESQGLPVQVANLLVQLRRRDVILRWSAPAWARADKIIRECSQAVTVCAGYLSQAPDPLTGRLWPERRLFRWKTYSTANFDEWSTNKQGKLSADRAAWFWRPGSEAGESYRTMDDVSSIGDADTFGNCVHCGGRRPRPLCKCDH